MIDEPRTVRPGEQLDMERLSVFLAENLPGAAGPLVIEQFPSGFSNLTYLLRLGERQLVLRRPPFGAAIKSGHDMAREYRILCALRPVYPKAPAPLLYSDDLSIIGAPFYVMERLQGVILRGRPSEGLDLAPEVMRSIAVAAVDNLAAIHAVDYVAAGLGDLGRPDGYVARQIEGWTKRYRAAQTDDLVAIEHVIDWLGAHLPPDAGAALIHNDYKFDNLMLDPRNLGEIAPALDDADRLAVGHQLIEGLAKRIDVGRRVSLVRIIELPRPADLLNAPRSGAGNLVARLGVACRVVAQERLQMPLLVVPQANVVEGNVVVDQAVLIATPALMPFGHMQIGHGPANGQEHLYGAARLDDVIVFRQPAGQCPPPVPFKHFPAAGARIGPVNPLPS